ncbi:MAG: helix-turn-helix domain-containing protein [Halieaceae bacterium]|jgi:AraC family transcriptional regulator|nr:helix-turn-helix domain-containing protein [Halieaceae bacterium]
MERWQKVRRELGHSPLAEGLVGGSNPVYVEHYLFSGMEKTVSGIKGTTLITQFGGARVREGESGAWRTTTMPNESLLAPAHFATHWHYAGTVDFAVFYFPDQSTGIVERLDNLAAKARTPLHFGDPLVSALALQIVRELHKGLSCDERFMAMLVSVMMEQVYRSLTTPETRGFNPRHIHYSRLQAVLNHIRDHPGGDLSVTALAAKAGVSVAHFRRLFRDAMGSPPHRYVLASRLEKARNLLATTSLPIAHIAEECGFSSQSHFTACFRAAHASTPAEYRSHLLETTASVAQR